VCVCIHTHIYIYIYNVSTYLSIGPARRSRSRRIPRLAYPPIYLSVSIQIYQPVYRPVYVPLQHGPASDETCSHARLPPTYALCHATHLRTRTGVVGGSSPKSAEKKTHLHTQCDADQSIYLFILIYPLFLYSSIGPTPRSRSRRIPRLPRPRRHLCRAPRSPTPRNGTPRHNHTL